MFKVAHLTSVHSHMDTRIFVKECATLAVAGFEVHLIAPGAPDALAGDVRLHGVAKSAGRLARMTGTARAVYKKACEVDAQLYHFHDPELILVGLALKARGKKVIYDMHEDVPRQIMDKQWIAKPFRNITSFSFETLQNLACRVFDTVVLAESLYIESLPKSLTSGAQKSQKYITVRNYPLLDELRLPAGGREDKKPTVCYVGEVTKVRGAVEMVEAAGRSGVKLLMGGRMESDGLLKQLEAMPGWSNVDYLGPIDRTSVAKALADATAGLVTLHPVPNYTVSEPTKLFEYMSAAIPVISSDFPIWRKIIDGCDCGICVDPLDPEAIAGAIRYMIDNPEDARRMGENGRRAVEEKYNWEIEGRKLVDLYKSLLA